MRIREFSNEAIRELALKKVSERDFRNLLIVAHHEAGHAVAAWHFHLKFRYVTILPDKESGSLGHLMHNKQKWFRPDCDSSDRVILHAEHWIKGLFAGQIAESKFRRRKPRWGMESDDHLAVDLAMHLGGSEDTINAYLHYCFLASRDLVNTFWREVEAVAWGLLEFETASREEVLELIWPGSAKLRASLKAKGRATARLGKPKEE